MQGDRRLLPNKFAASLFTSSFDSDEAGAWKEVLWNTTDYQSKYFAHELTRRFGPDSPERLAGAVAGAQVDLNPHQVDAALFAFRSPFAKGALLADEVGLGKTIEAGLVISQRWAEGKRRILIIAPSNLRKQWHQELAEKFFIPGFILEAKSYNEAFRNGDFQPFDKQNRIVICSYQFARNKASDIQRLPWDLVVIDEAHRLRNVYKPSNVIANTLKLALADKPKILLTATPLQNSLMELFGLVSFIDDKAFGDQKSFREQFANSPTEAALRSLRERLRPVCHRTLRRQVTAYVPYTKRYPLVEEFTPEESEDRLYALVSDYLQRDNLQALPSSQKTLMTLVLRKLLASSTFAIAGALNSLSSRLEEKLARDAAATSPAEDLDQDYEALDETSEEWDENSVQEPLTPGDRQAIEREIKELKSFSALATSISHNAKGKALLKALAIAFAKARELGAAEKAIIFTESRRTQNYLLRLLTDSDFADGILMFNGTNSDEGSRKIYQEWLERHKGSDRVTGSRTADMRSALVDYFREQGRIMIATEAGAEGINLQFCSLVVNYDLPWNPQRIEQRIGRCHRYGQKYDVVVVNFINRKNDADQRVFQLLSEKFKLFEGVFGASDEVLGALESGVDFERRINGIYQQCRQPEDIKKAFDQLQLDLSLEIDEAMSQTNRKLLENFDDDVRDKLKIRDDDAKVYLDKYEKTLIRVTRHELADHADFVNTATFTLKSLPDWASAPDVPLGLYELPRRSGEAHFYRLTHPLGETVLARAKTRELPPAEVVFDYQNHAGIVSAVEPYEGKTGWLTASILTIEALDSVEDHLLLSGKLDDEFGGQNIPPDVLAQFMKLPANSGKQISAGAEVITKLESISENQKLAIQGDISRRNARFFEEEATKLDGWADDLKVGLEREIKEIDRQIKEARRAATAALGLEQKLEAQKQIRSLETVRNSKRRNLFDAQDEIDKQRNGLIEKIEGKLKQVVSMRELFCVWWKVT
jgi:ERCC4-related helicase